MSKLIPEIRFPEFKNDGVWEEKRLEEVYDFKRTNSFSRAMLNYTKGKIKNIHYGDIHTKFNTLFDITKEDVPFVNGDVVLDYINEDDYCKEGDIIFADASEDLQDIGKSIEIINLNGEKLLSGLHTLLARRKEKNIEVGFGAYLFLSPWIRRQIQKESQGTKVLGISASRISNIQLMLPKKRQEQHRIASFLSSLDVLITAEHEKLEGLQEHKKGLMQKLFPQEGKKMPEYRFPEFRNDGGWEEKRLGDKEVSSIVSEKVPVDKLNIETYISTENMLPDFSGISTITKLPESGSFTKYREGDILISNIRPYLKKVWKSNKTGATSNDIIVFRAGNLILSDFLEFIIKNDVFIKYIMSSAKGVKMPRGDKNSMVNYAIFVPSKKEQQRIASSLSALDELIQAQNDKIEALKQYKKGLMQGVFPSMC